MQKGRLIDCVRACVCPSLPPSLVVVEGKCRHEISYGYVGYIEKGRKKQGENYKQVL